MECVVVIRQIPLLPDFEALADSYLPRMRICAGKTPPMTSQLPVVGMGLRQSR